MNPQEKLARINERLFAAQRMFKDEKARTQRLRLALIRMLTILKSETEVGLREVREASDKVA